MKHHEAYFGTVETFKNSWHVKTRWRCRIAVALFVVARRLVLLADWIDEP